MKRILVSGCGPASINFVKSLRLAPEKMFILGTDINKHHILLSPADKAYLVPSATNPNYIEMLKEIIIKEKIEFIHPQPDIEVAVLSENRNKLEVLTFLPSKKTVQICQDKFMATQVWRKKGILTAKTFELKNEKDVEKAFNELGSPIWIRAKYGAGGVGSTPAHNEETALSWIKYWKSRGLDWMFIAQEYLHGRNIGFHSIFKNGELIISMARERLEYIYPHLAPSGITGTPSVQRTIHDDEINKIGVEAVLAIDSKYNGIACVDLKENDEGTPCPTEINSGRMFTTSYFFSFAGEKLYTDCGMPVKWFANIPYLYIKLAFKETYPKIPKFNILPKNLYWVRHMDAPAILIRNGKVLGTMYR